MRRECLGLAIIPTGGQSPHLPGVPLKADVRLRALVSVCVGLAAVGIVFFVGTVTPLSRKKKSGAGLPSARTPRPSARASDAHDPEPDPEKHADGEADGTSAPAPGAGGGQDRPGADSQSPDGPAAATWPTTAMERRARAARWGTPEAVNAEAWTFHVSGIEGTRLTQVTATRRDRRAKTRQGARALGLAVTAGVPTVDEEGRS